MPGPTTDPFAPLSRVERWRLVLRFHRVRREVARDRRSATMAALIPLVGRDLVVAAVPTRSGPGAIGEVTLASGTELRLAACSRHHLAQLHRLSRDRAVVLERAADHGNRWGLYFRGGDERLALLVEAVAVRSNEERGGTRLLTSV